MTDVVTYAMTLSPKDRDFAYIYGWCGGWDLNPPKAGDVSRNLPFLYSKKYEREEQGQKNINREIELVTKLLDSLCQTEYFYVHPMYYDKENTEMKIYGF